MINGKEAAAKGRGFFVYVPLRLKHHPRFVYHCAIVIFAPALSKFQSHIAWCLLCLFGITFLPFNAMHHHALDEHGMAQHVDALKTQHHCELDEYFCETSNEETTCEHPQHIASTLTKCFSCDFHFIKHYRIGHFTVPQCQQITFSLYKSHWATPLLDALVFISNKGPPVAFA